MLNHSFIINLTMTKRALLIGINYPGTSVELHGCVTDVRRMQKCLIDHFGFFDKDIVVLIDTDKTGIQPTGKNIRSALEELINSGNSGDTLVFHYSGHGTRLLPEPGVEADATGFDECITPCDMNLILDHEFREMVSKVKEGCRLTIISDSCHSGGLIEDVKEQIGESYMKPPEFGIANYLLSIVMNLLPTFGIASSHEDHGTGSDSFTSEIELENGERAHMKTRYLPLGSYLRLLEQQTGFPDIEIGNIRQTLVKVFGNDSMQRNGHRGLLSRFLGECEINVVGTEAPKLIADKGILLSGCQTDQRSKDVYVRRTGEAYGAFSDAIQRILLETRNGKKITNKEMVLKAREILESKNFSQRPGLYCHDRYVNEPFIC